MGLGPRSWRTPRGGPILRLMSEPSRFVEVGDRLELRLDGRRTADEVRALVAGAVEEARRRSKRKLFVDGMGLEDFPVPSTMDRYQAMVGWANAGAASLRMAIAARPEIVDPSKFDVKLASVLGFSCEVFTSEADALAWLDAAG